MNQDIIKKLVKWDDIYSLCEKINRAIPRPDIIIGIANGGIIPACMLARITNTYNVHYIGVRSYTNENTQSDIRLYHEPVLGYSNRHSNVLVVDDILDTGKTFKFVNDYLTQREFHSVHFCALHYKQLDNNIQYTPSNFTYGTKCESNIWIQYPWEKQ